jgi:hypothetical protein
MITAIVKVDRVGRKGYRCARPVGRLRGGAVGAHLGGERDEYRQQAGLSAGVDVFFVVSEYVIIGSIFGRGGQPSILPSPEQILGARRVGVAVPVAYKRDPGM